jgi:hypothetical protein
LATNPTATEGEQVMNEREEFEKEVQYRQFLGRNKDGSYSIEWLEVRWQGFSAGWQAARAMLAANKSVDKPEQ